MYLLPHTYTVWIDRKYTNSQCEKERDKYSHKVQGLDNMSPWTQKHLLLIVNHLHIS